jgi:hypothetical protein
VTEWKEAMSGSGLGRSGLGFARIAHLLASHWYYLFMSMHIALTVCKLVPYSATQK